MSTSKPKVLTFQIEPKEAVDAEGYLTPLYFNKQVLTRYLYDSRFQCEFASETYGTISGEDFNLPFGINCNQSVIAWLGDIKNAIPIREQFYWLVENKSPENETRSEFFDAQVKSIFTEPPVIVKVLNSLAKFNAVFHHKFGVHLYHDRSIDERIDEARRYVRLVLNNKDDFKRFVSELNEIVNENVNNKDIARFLNQRNIKYNAGMRGNKLLEKIYVNIINDNDNLIAPFFYLYDLRLWADHSISDDRLKAVADKLAVKSSEQYQNLMSALNVALHHSIEKLIKSV